MILIFQHLTYIIKSIKDHIYCVINSKGSDECTIFLTVTSSNSIDNNSCSEFDKTCCWQVNNQTRLN